MAKRFITPFAEAGDRSPMPDTPIGSDSNYQTGYPSQYEEDPITEPTARFVERDKSNQLYNDITANIKEWQEHVYPEFIESAVNGGVPFPYAKGSIVTKSGITYISKENSNEDVPTSDKWNIYSPVYPHLDFENVSDMVAGIIDGESVTFNIGKKVSTGSTDWRILPGTATKGISIAGGLKAIPLNGLWVNDYGAFFDGVTPTSSEFATAMLDSQTLKSKLMLSGDYLIESPLTLFAGLRVGGTGGAVQQGSKMIASAGINIFELLTGFAAESMQFDNIAFDSDTPGVGKAFFTPNTTFLSNTRFTNCVWFNSLQRGIDAPIIVCEFNKCDFGSYPGGVRDFQAIRAIGTVASREPNANTFNRCIFRNSSAANQIQWGSYGVQWRFNQCDFERNECTQRVIECDGAGAVTFNGGYIELNTCAEFIRTIGNAGIGFTNLITFKNVHLNSPCTDALIAKTLSQTKIEVSGCYGLLNCNLLLDQNGNYNRADEVQMSYGNSFNVGTGSIGEIGTIVSNGYTIGSTAIKNLVSENFSAYNNDSQVITSGSPVKLNMLGEDWDSAFGWYDVFNSRFMARKAGKWQLNVNIKLTTATDGEWLIIDLYKNGVKYKGLGSGTSAGGNFPTVATGMLVSSEFTGEVEDVFELYATSSVTAPIVGGNVESHWSMTYSSQ